MRDAGRRSLAPGAEARVAHGPATEIDSGTAGRGTAALAEGATLAELARSYNFSQATISRLTA
jgi:hypothetical protein